MFKKRSPEKVSMSKNVPPPNTDTKEILSSLTSREKEVFALLMHGKKLNEIANELSIKFTTVNTHQKNIYKKLEVNTRAECFVRYGGMNINK